MNDKDLDAAGHAITNFFDDKDPSFHEISVFMCGWCAALDYIHESAKSQNDFKQTKPRGIEITEPGPTQPSHSRRSQTD